MSEKEIRSAVLSAMAEAAYERTTGYPWKSASKLEKSEWVFRQSAALDIALKAAAEIADDHTPGKGGATLVAHVTGQNIKRAILALTSEGMKE